jgi:hypothetical protein
VTVQWIAATQTYHWTISNINGTRTWSKPASELNIVPATTYFAVGTVGNVVWQASGWTIFDISYGQGQVSTVPFTIELAGSGTATVDGTPAADEDDYYGSPELHGVASGASDASFIKSKVLTGSAWTVKGNCEAVGGTAYSHQLMTSAWSGQPEAYSGIPSTLMLQILKAADGTVSFAYVNTSGNLLTWNQTTEAWQAGSNVLDIVLDGGGDDEWWVCYDGTDYWLAVSNGTDARAATAPAASVRGGGANCLFAAGRPWTTGWNQTADFTINNLALVPHFVEPPLSTNRPFIVNLAGGATATINGLPAADEDTYAGGLSELTMAGSNVNADAAFVKTPSLGRHPWTVTIDFWSRFADGLAFAAEIKDPAWSGQPEAFVAWPGNNKMMMRAEDAPDISQIISWGESGSGLWYDLGSWVPYEAMLGLYFGEWDQGQMFISYDGTNYFLSVSFGGDGRMVGVPGPMYHHAYDPIPIRQQKVDSYIAIGDMYTNLDGCDFIISSAKIEPFLNPSLRHGNFAWAYPDVQFPTVNKICDVEQLRDGVHVTMGSDKIISVGKPDKYFVQEPDRSAGIAVLGGLGTDPLTPGTIRKVAGLVSEKNGERVIYGDGSRSQNMGTTTAPKPLDVTGRSLGGGALGKVRGVEQGTGLNNLGLLVKTTGRVTYVAPDKSYFLLDDGSAIADDPAGLGVKVHRQTVMTSPPALNSYIAVTGVARPYIRPDGKLGREIMFRTEGISIQVLAGP